MYFIRPKIFINPNHQVLIQLVAAFVSPSSCIQAFSLGLKNALLGWRWLGARAAGPGTCRLHLAAFSHQSIKHLLCVQIQHQVERLQDAVARSLN